MPRLRATSISSLVSIVNVTSPSTSAGVQPGVVERGLHRFARELELGAPDSLENSVWPMPAIAARPRQPVGRHARRPTGKLERRRAADVLAELVHRAQLDLDDALVAVALRPR